MKDAVQDRLVTQTLRLDYHNFGTVICPCRMRHGTHFKYSQTPSMDAASNVVLRGKIRRFGPTSSRIARLDAGTESHASHDPANKLFSMNTLRISPTSKSGSPQEDSELCRPSRHVSLKTGDKTLSLSGHHNIHFTKTAQDDRPRSRTVACRYPNIIRIMFVKAKVGDVRRRWV